MMRGTLQAETASLLPELGHLAEGIDYRNVIAYVKAMRDAARPLVWDEMGRAEVTVHGRQADVGWVSSRAAATGESIFRIGSEGGRQIYLVEGGMTVLVQRACSTRQSTHEVFGAHKGQPALLALDHGDIVGIYDAWGPNENTCWFISFPYEAHGIP